MTNSLLHIIEGDRDVSSKPTLAQIPLKDQVRTAKIFLGDHIHEDWMYLSAMAAAAELEFWVNWLNTMNSPSGVQIKLDLPDRYAYAAKVQLLVTKPKNCQPPAREYQILIQLGCIRRLLGVANRLLYFLQGSSGESWVLDMVQDWRPREDALGILSFGPAGMESVHNARIVVDALVLMLLHEAAHAFAGHLHSQLKKISMFYRVLEAEADYLAGWLYVAGHDAVAGAINSTSTVLQRVPPAQTFASKWMGSKYDADAQLANRLITAAFASHLAMEIEFRQSERYYLPSTRTTMLIEGAKAKLGGSSRAMRTFEEVYRLILPQYMSIFAHMRAPESTADLELANALHSNDGLRLRQEWHAGIPYLLSELRAYRLASFPGFT